MHRADILFPFKCLCTGGVYIQGEYPSVREGSLPFGGATKGSFFFWYICKERQYHSVVVAVCCLFCLLSATSSISGIPLGAIKRGYLKDS